MALTKTRKRPTNVPEQGFWYDEASHAYFMDGKSMTGCTTILGVLNKPALIGWAAKMAVEYLALAGQPYYGPDDNLENHYIITGEQLEEAKTAHAKKRDDAASKGTDTHALVEEYVKFCIDENSCKPTALVFKGRESYGPIQGFVDWAIKENVTFLASEQKLYSKKHFIAGTADLIFEKDGKRYIGDIKTYKKIWDRVPFYQCAGYALMWEEMQPDMVADKVEAGEVGVLGAAKAMFTNYIDGYCIINLPKERAFNEAEDVLWSFDIEGDTAAFLACITIYRQNANFAKPKWHK